MEKSKKANKEWLNTHKISFDPAMAHLFVFRNNSNAKILGFIEFKIECFSFEIICSKIPKHIQKLDVFHLMKVKRPEILKEARLENELIFTNLE